MPLRVQNAPAAAKKEIGLGLSVLNLALLFVLLKTAGRPPVAAHRSETHQMDPNAQPLPQPGFAQPYTVHVAGPNDPHAQPQMGLANLASAAAAADPAPEPAADPAQAWPAAFFA